MKTHVPEIPECPLPQRESESVKRSASEPPDIHAGVKELFMLCVGAASDLIRPISRLRSHATALYIQG